MRLGGSGEAVVTLAGDFPAGYAGYTIRAVPALLKDAAAASPFTVTSGAFTRLAEYRLPAADVHMGTGLISSFSFLLTNSSTGYLPAGESAVFFRDEYVGSTRFDGLSSARCRTVSR